MRFSEAICPPTTRIISALTLITLVTSQVGAAQSRPITVEDCVRTRRIVDQEVHISPDGSKVAYVVKAPDIVTNRNIYQLYVRDLKSLGGRENGHLFLHADRISGTAWLGSDRIIARVENKSGNSENFESEVSVVNVTTGTLDKLEYPKSIEDYSASADGGTIVFSVKMSADRKSSIGDSKVRKERQARGYPLVFGEGSAEAIEHLPEDEILLARRTRPGKLDVKKLVFRESENSPKQSSLRNVQRLSLSPNGKYLLITYSVESIPAGWAEQPYIRLAHSLGTFFDTYVLGLYEISTGRLRVGFNFLGADLRESWSGDSRSYSVVGPSPFGSDDARMEVDAAAASGNMFRYMSRFRHVFIVDVATGTTTMVLKREDPKLWNDLPVWWSRSDGPMIVRRTDNSFAIFAMQKQQWKEITRFDLWKDEGFLSSLASDGELLVGVSQTSKIPPDLFVYDVKNMEARFVTDLNPEYRGIQLGRVERVEWTNRYGSECAGFVIKPVGYQEGRRYPMVFLSAPPSDVFISDAVYTTAYAPQSLANAGFVVVIAQYPLDDRISQNEFPGDMSAAYNWMAMVESAVDLLADRGLVDKNNVGIAGFSRTSWLTDFTLTHSDYHFVAASSADSGIYIYGAYFKRNSLSDITGAETQVGGPPYGETFKHWLMYAPPFNAEKATAAILMEYVGTGEHGFEFFTALSRLGKSVEFYRYPKGNHPLDTPFERIASLQRNVDWFRFWMQGYEGKAPEYDPEQYVRWRKLRKLQEQQRSNAATN